MSTRRRMTVPASVLLLLLAVQPAAAAAKPTIAKGLYKGTVNGEDEGAALTVNMRIITAKPRLNKTAGRISYSAPTPEGDGITRCKGTLTYRSRKGSQFTFRETFAGQAAEDCLSGGTVTLTRVSARTVGYRWALDEEAPSTGQLTR